jgi:SAM-dependent methyltransferase
MEQLVSEDRLDRERDYHNKRFEEETRNNQSKYYWALRDCNADYKRLVEEKAENARVLEYGCALGDWSIRIAPRAAAVEGIDISDVAVAKAAQVAAAKGLLNCRFHVMDAERTTFEDNRFDLVFGSGIIHHLDTRKSLAEIHRILKPGGVAVFKEPLGQNIGINLYRAFTPSARTPDEHPLLPEDEAIARSLFDKVDWSFYGLTTLASVPFRNIGIGQGLYKATASLDRWIAGVYGARWQMWYALITLQK